jgi:hypothetical protein
MSIESKSATDYPFHCTPNNAALIRSCRLKFSNGRLGKVVLIHFA